MIDVKRLKPNVAGGISAALADDDKLRCPGQRSDADCYQDTASSGHDVRCRHHPLLTSAVFAVERYTRDKQALVGDDDDDADETWPLICR